LLDVDFINTGCTVFFNFFLHIVGFLFLAASRAVSIHRIRGRFVEGTG